MSVTCAYRSRDPEVVKSWTDATDAIRAYVEATRAVLEAAGLGGYQVYRDSHGWRPGHFAGLAIPDGEKPPAGWRMTARYAVPDKRTKAGRQAEAALAAVKHPGDPLLKLAGMMPDAENGNGAFVSPAVRLLEDGTTVYVGWPACPEGRQSFLGPRGVTVDLDRWERIPLSTYWLAFEAADAAKAAAS